MPEPSTIPPQWFCQRAKFRRVLRAAVRAIARDFSIRCAAKARRIDVDFRVVSPPKRAKFEAECARLQSKQLKQEVTARRSRNQNRHHHGVTESRRGTKFFYREAMKPGRRILNIFSHPFLASWLPYQFACFALVCALLVKIFVKWQESNG
jgi:hypothetical protein